MSEAERIIDAHCHKIEVHLESFSHLVAELGDC